MPPPPPAISQPPCTAARRNVLEATNWDSGVSSWISALMVGQNIQKPLATSIAMTYKCQTCAWCRRASTATMRITTARSASSTISSRRRSSRSMMTPLTGMISIAGKVCRTSSVPSATSECVACRMYQITAAIFMPLPVMEIMLAVKTSRSGLCCRIERIPATVNESRQRRQRA
jgi:hypothetical protein